MQINAQFNRWTSLLNMQTTTQSSLIDPILELLRAAMCLHSRICHCTLIKRHVQHTLKLTMVPLTCNHNNDRPRLSHGVNYRLQNVSGQIGRPAIMHHPDSMHRFYTPLY